MLGVLLFAFLSAGRRTRWRRWASRRRSAPARIAFLHGIRWGVPALTLYFCMRYLSEGLHWTLPTMLLGFGGLLVLVPLGYVLTFGAFGLPELGAGGLGIASAIMMWLQALAFALYLWRSQRFADLRPVRALRSAALAADPRPARAPACRSA